MKYNEYINYVDMGMGLGLIGLALIINNAFPAVIGGSWSTQGFFNGVRYYRKTPSLIERFNKIYDGLIEVKRAS